MKAVSSLSGDMEEQIDLGRGLDRHRVTSAKGLTVSYEV